MMKISAKPVLEKIEPDFGTSFSYRTYNKNHLNKNNTFWHYHPELELVYVNAGSGKRQIGSHVSHYRKGDLIFIGSKLPHCGFTDSLTGKESETVIQMKEDFLGETFFDVPEMKKIRSLLQNGKMGIVFHGEDKKNIGDAIETLRGQDNFDRLLGLISVLKMLGEARNYTILNAKGFILETELEDNNRVNVVFNFVKEEFHRPITLEEVAEMVSMTPPSFCRYFRKITGKTFVQFVNEYRLAHAAKLLQQKQISILEVSYESGFNNFSHFNRQFKKFTKRTPSDYRNELKIVVS